MTDRSQPRLQSLPPSPLVSKMSITKFTASFETLSTYSPIFSSCTKYLSSLLKTDLESKIDVDNDSSEDFQSDEDDPRYMISNLCDWVCQEIRKRKGKEIEKAKKKKMRRGSSKTARPANSDDDDDQGAMYADFTVREPRTFNGSVEEELWHYVNMYVMEKVWSARLVCSHPDYPVDEETFVNKVDIMAKNTLPSTTVSMPPLPVVEWVDGGERVKLIERGQGREHDDAALEALVNFLPNAKTPQHVKGVALHIIKKGTEYLKKWEHKKDVNTDDLIDLVAKLILKVNPGHLRSTAWALTYYDVRGGSGEGMYASAVLSSAVEYLKNGDHGNNNRVGSYEEFLRGYRLIKTGSWKEGTAVLKQLSDVNLLGPGGRGSVLQSATLTGRPEVVQSVCETLTPFMDLRIEYHTGMGRTCLFYAVERADYDVVALLLKFGADRDMVDNRGDTALLVAERARLRARVKGGQAGTVWDDIVDLLRTKLGPANLAEECRKGTTVVRHLIAQGAVVNSLDDQNETSPLIEAAKYGRYEVLLLLASANVDPNVRNRRKETALHWCKSLKMVLKLLELGAERGAKDENGKTPADWAEKDGRYEIKAVIANNPEPPPSLCHLAKEKNGEAILGLMLQGLSSNVQDPNLGFTPLIAAVYNNDISTATVLLRLGEKRAKNDDVGDEMRSLVPKGVLSDPNFKGRGGMTALHYAAQEGHVKMVALLLRSGGDRHNTDGKSRTPYVIAHAKEGETFREIETLLTNDPLKVSICAAAGRGRWEDVVSLLLQGVDVNSQHNVLANGDASSPDASWKEMIFWGYKRDADGGDDNVGPSDAIRHELFSPLISACAYNRPRIVTSLLKHPQVQVNMPNSKGQTPLMYAAAVGNLDLILPLLKVGADRSLQDAKNRDATNWAEAKGHPFASTVISTDPSKVSSVAAALTGNPDIVKSLILQDVQMNTVVAGQTALIAAAKLNHIAVISTILATNCDLEAKDDNGESALTASSRLGHVQTVLALLKAGAKREQKSVAAASSSGQILCGVIVANDPATSFIHDACYHGKLLLVEALLAQDVDPNALDPRMTKNASTPLIAACTGLSVSSSRQGCKMIIQRLLSDSRTNWDLKNAKGCTAMMVAAAFDVEVVKLLFKSGADTALKDCNGHNAAWYSYNGVGSQAWGNAVGGGGAGQRIKFWAAL